MTTIRSLVATDAVGLADLFASLSESDRTLIREDLHDTSAVGRLVAHPDLHWVATSDDGALVGYCAIDRLPGWSDHVGELRLVVRASGRGAGIGRSLVRTALLGALSAGVGKVVVELVAEQEPVLQMFSELGFTGEALLRDHIRDRDGRLHDLVMLAYLARDAHELLDTVGITDAIQA
ncbi:GNAT family N-acetyltransferase [Tsukamurella sp. 8F]|uniref:GNAT family N-acetyltransferase n=1 Tax=unclassified Tsukamurella TaxID=2633480 RepID=UPI0023B94CAD|nr:MULTISPECIES: GNAT family N-acetyltransferase [unclassified Tsukamurella]MDF0529676.1 GNAT family N-acetyltransferase [Tsukamurella sp. 8J]MDF0585961.1 GNAT family N-acetyltransferase [Tsukamurella sp. 8F]